MPLWGCFLIVVIAGAVGGVVNAYFSNNGGFVMPEKAKLTGSTIWRPGVLGNILVGSVASVTAWCLYGPLANIAIRSFKQTEEFRPMVIALSILVGLGGARWLSNEVDKLLLRDAGKRLAKNLPDKNVGQIVSAAFENGSPADCLEATAAGT